MASTNSYVPNSFEGRALYLRDFLDNISSGIGRLYGFFGSKGFSSVTQEALARERVKFLGTLSDVEFLEQEFEALTGSPHGSYHCITKRLNELIIKSGNQLNYRDAQRISLN